MLHECLVIDNKNFFKNGTIRVRLKSDISSIDMMKDLSINPKKSINDYGNQRYEKYGDGEAEFKYDDRDVRIMSPIGGAYDYGLFMLPQPNTWGVVDEIGTYWDDSIESRFIWVGALSKFNLKSGAINIPSDKLDNPNGCNDKGKANIETPENSIIFKQKETHISNSAEEITDESQDTLDWKTRLTNNMVVLNDKKIYAVHRDYDEDKEFIGNSSIELGKDGATIKYEKPDNSGSKMHLRPDGGFDMISSPSEEGEDKAFKIIRTTKNGIAINYSEDDTNMSISMGKNQSGNGALSINFSKGSSAPPAEIVFTKEGITINSNSNISINSGKNGTVSLGTGENYILTSPSPGTWNYDNHTVTAVKNAKA